MAEIQEKPTEVATAVPYDPQRQKFLLLKRNFETDIHPGKWKSRPASSEEAVQEDSRDGVFDFPGGKIEDGEDSQATALRELEEETGISGELIRSGESFVLDTEDGKFKIFPFLILVEEDPKLNSEHLDFSWIEPGELEDYDTVGGPKEDLRRVGVLDG